MNKHRGGVLTSVALAIFCAIVLCVVVISVINMSPDDARVIDYLEVGMGVPIVRAYIDSPAVMIYVDGLREFKTLISELNVSVVYRGITGAQIHYYLFNEPMTIGYCYTLSRSEINAIWKLIK